MKLRSKDIINAVVASLGYQLEPIRKSGKPSANSAGLIPDYLPSEPFRSQFQLMSQLGRKSLIIFDVGANKGDTIAQYRKLFNNSSIHSFEPFPEMIETLQSRFSQDQQVQIIPKAVSEQSGKAIFFVNSAHATNSLLPRPEHEKQFYPNAIVPKAEIEVDTVDLDSYCANNNIQQINILKLDIQGAELQAIKGANSLLTEHRIDIVYCEIQFVPLYEGAAQFDQIWSTLREFGYSLVDIYDLHRSPGGQILFGDALFVSPHCKETILDQYRVSS